MADTKTLLVVFFSLAAFACGKEPNRQQSSTEGQAKGGIIKPDEFSISYLRASNVRPGEYFLIMVNGKQSYRLTEINERAGFRTVSLAQADKCPPVDGRCFNDSENFLPIVVTDKPVGDYRLGGGKITLSKRVGFRNGCNEYVIGSERNQIISSQIYDYCADTGVYRIRTFGRAGNIGDEYVLVSRLGLMYPGA